MLIVSVAINNKIIDLICIHNTDNVNKKGLDQYELIDPVTGKELLPVKIYHKRDSGYRSLLRKALKLLEENQVPEIQT